MAVFEKYFFLQFNYSDSSEEFFEINSAIMIFIEVLM